MEVLACKIQAQQAIVGILHNQKMYEVLFFADNVLLCLSDPQLALPSVYQCLYEFAPYSGLTVNKDKTIIFPFTTTIISSSGISIPLSNHFDYLGISFSRDPSRLLDLNIVPVISKIEQTLE